MKTKTNPAYDRNRFDWRQMRDTIAGPSTVKMANQVYLPMPAGMADIPAEKVGKINAEFGTGNFTNSSQDYQSQYLPWYHSNPAYRAYLQRARFPDLAANALRGMLGVSTKKDPEVELPASLEYLKTTATNDGNSLVELFSYVLSESFSVGKSVLVLDINESDNTFYITTYTAESNNDWEYGVVKGKRVLTRVELIDEIQESKTFTREYSLDKEGHVVVTKKLNGEISLSDDAIIYPKYRGKFLTAIPVFFVGTLTNSAEPDIIPLIGISDIAIMMYQISADLRQGQFMTCNPTLFVFGMSDREVPSTIGSQVIVAVKNPQGSAIYPETDTSAFEHLREYTNDLKDEAVSYGANFISPNNKGRESGEALSLKKMTGGANLVQSVKLAGLAFNELFEYIGILIGSPNSCSFKANTEFSELEISASDLKELVNAWLGGAIDQNIVIDNFRDAGYVKPDDTNDQIKARILLETPIGEEDDDLGGGLNDDGGEE